MTKTVNFNLSQSIIHHYSQPKNITTSSRIALSPYKDLSFPLNVYAHALYLQEGKVTYLHYGLFQNDKVCAHAAQQHSTDLLVDRLPPPPCRILEVGVGLGGTFSLLHQKGYYIHGISPDEQQIAYLKKNLGAKASNISCESLEDFKCDPATFDVILFQESAQYIEPLIIFNKALDLLSSSGDLLIIDEFALKYDGTEIENLHLLNDIVALAGRFGFELIEKIDLSAMAAPTLDYLLQTTASHWKDLIRDLALSDEQLTQLYKSNLSYRQKYADGEYCYALLHFKKRASPKWRIQILDESHASEMIDLFKRTFNQSMSLKDWEWKYKLNLGRQIGIWRENQLIAHYGGCGRKIMFFGQPQNAVQITDVMVDAKDRGILTKKNPFFMMAATFPERFVGYGKLFLLGYGFPNERAMKVAERHKLYAEVGNLVEISWNPLSRSPLWKTHLQVITRNHSNAIINSINECWQRMAKDLKNAIIGVRDYQYLQYRYFNHPNQEYQIVLVKNRFGSKTHGILILRHDLGSCEIIDLIAPLAEIPLLITHARRLAGIQGATRVFCHISENFVTYFATNGGVIKTLEIRIPATIWSNAPSPEILRNKWWLMSGDKDFR